MILKTTLITVLFITVGLNFAAAQTKIISEGDKWRYYDDKAPPPDGWINSGTVDINWKKGKTPLGYGDDRIQTIISYGDDKDKKHITKYFQKTFRIEDPYEYLTYELKIQRDDGIVVYLNGQEILRNNMPDGKINNNTKALDLIISDVTEGYIYRKLLLSEDLVAGNNTISASVHQTRESSSDCLFNLELVGDNNPNMIPLVLKERTIKNLHLDLKVKELNHKLELEKRDSQLGFLKHVKNNYKIALYSICILFLIAILGLLYIFSSHKKKQKKLTQNINDLKEAIINKDRELMSSSLNTVQNQQFLKELKDILSNTTSEDLTTIKIDLKKVIRKIDYTLNHDDDWTNLLSHFNAVHTGFLGKLMKLHPALSEIEQRHCIFIKLHMQTKEIAQILHIDPKSVQVARYRIKKKMSLSETIDLRTYLQEI